MGAVDLRRHARSGPDGAQSANRQAQRGVHSSYVTGGDGARRFRPGEGRLKRVDSPASDPPSQPLAVDMTLLLRTSLDDAARRPHAHRHNYNKRQSCLFHDLEVALGPTRRALLTRQRRTGPRGATSRRNQGATSSRCRGATSSESACQRGHRAPDRAELVTCPCIAIRSAG